VATDVGGVSDVVRSNENGFLVPSKDAVAIARALSQLQDVATRARLSQAARELAALYHWDVLVHQLEGLLFGADFAGQSC